MIQDQIEEETSSSSNEKEKEVKLPPSDEQIWSAMSFAFILIIIGLPLWWKTTEVPRVSLPTSEISQLTNFDFKFNFTISLVTQDKSRGEKLQVDLQRLFEIFQYSSLYGFSWKFSSFPRSLIGSCKTLKEIDDKLNHPQIEGNIQLMEVPGLSRFTPKLFIIGNHRTMYFSSDADSLTVYEGLEQYFLARDHLNRTIEHISTKPLKSFDETTQRRVAPSASYDILLTILNPDLNFQFDVKEAERLLTPLLKPLSDMTEFSVKSQWLHFVDLDLEPVSLNERYFLPKEKLSHVITALEKKLGLHVSKNSCLNFVLWVPSCKMVPLFFDQQLTTAFLSPRWGGIQIFNPIEECNDTSLKIQGDSTRIMPIFIQQVRLLLGLKSVEEDIESGFIMPDSVLRVWEKDILMKSRTVEQLALARHTLQSLSYLLNVIANIVINEKVGLIINEALEAMTQCERALKRGELKEGHDLAKLAFLKAEAAFYDPSLLQLLYFPEDQKYAVYIPLFLPVMIPVLISLKTIQGWISDKLSKKEKID